MDSVISVPSMLSSSSTTALPLVRPLVKKKKQQKININSQTEQVKNDNNTLVSLRSRRGCDQNSGLSTDQMDHTAATRGALLSGPSGLCSGLWGGLYIHSLVASPSDIGQRNTVIDNKLIVN